MRSQCFFNLLSQVISVANGQVEAKKTGEISTDILENMEHLKITSSDLLKGSHIVDLFKQYKILTKMPSNKYFMPSLLLPDSTIAAVTIKQIESKPLLVQFESAHLPIEIFSALVVALSQTWEWDKTCCYRNHLRFVLAKSINVAVELIFRKSHLEIYATGESPPYQFIWKK